MPNVMVLGGRAYGTLYCCYCSVTHSCLTVCNSMDCSMPGFPVLHPLPKLDQTHVHWVGNAIQPSHPLLIVSFSSCLQSLPASVSFLMSQLFASGGQSIGVTVSASVLLRNIQDWFLLRLTGLISLQFKKISRVFSNTTVLTYSSLCQWNHGKVKVIWNQVKWNLGCRYHVPVGIRSIWTTLEFLVSTISVCSSKVSQYSVRTIQGSLAAVHGVAKSRIRLNDWTIE